MRATVRVTITEPETILEPELVPQLYSFQLGIIVAGVYLLPFLAWVGFSLAGSK